MDGSGSNLDNPWVAIAVARPACTRSKARAAAAEAEAEPEDRRNVWPLLWRQQEQQQVACLNQCSPLNRGPAGLRW
jgi:hypothetical protein